MKRYKCRDFSTGVSLMRNLSLSPNLDRVGTCLNGAGDGYTQEGELLINAHIAQVNSMTHRPANVPQPYADQAAHARYAVHARTFFLRDFVSIENKERLSYFPKLDVAGSIPVAHSIFPSTWY